MMILELLQDIPGVFEVVQLVLECPEVIGYMKGLRVFQDIQGGP